MDPGHLAEPRALAALFIALVIVAAVLVLTVGMGETPPRSEDQPVVLSPEGAPSQQQAEAASSACTNVGGDAGCVLFVLERTRDVRRMSTLAAEYRARQ